MYGKRRCPICKGVFTSENQSRKYCSEQCKAKAHAKDQKQWKKHHRRYYREWKNRKESEDADHG